MLHVVQVPPGFSYEWIPAAPLFLSSLLTSLAKQEKLHVNTMLCSPHFPLYMVAQRGKVVQRHRVIMFDSNESQDYFWCFL